MSNETTPKKSKEISVSSNETTPARSKGNLEKIRRKFGKHRFQKDGSNVTEAPKTEKSSRRDFLTLLFPKQKNPAEKPVILKKKRKGFGKGQLARRQKRIVAQASQTVFAEPTQSKKLKSELGLVASETPLLQSTSRRKFLKMAGMTAAAAALWRKAVAVDYDGGGSFWNDFGSSWILMGAFKESTA